ncbi:MAG: hypothetical protein DMG49_15885, partial [Acidobacteria bacterium]
MVFQVTGEVLQEEFANSHGPQFTATGSSSVITGNCSIPRSDLHDLEFGGIITKEQHDVRR